MTIRDADSLKLRASRKELVENLEEY